MLLSDLGADIVKVARVGEGRAPELSFTHRGRRSIELDLKSKDSIAAVLDLIAAADVLIEWFRPGVMERLGLGPDDALARNPRLVYGRMTGWGQEGPLADSAGHDINYISVTGALGSIVGRDGEPVQPLNLLGDYGGGSLYLVVGILSAIIEAARSGKGQVVDAAMCDGAAHIMTTFYAMLAMGRWSPEPRVNLLDGGAPYYRSYRCADGKFMAVGAIEKQFYALFCKLIDASPRLAAHQNDKSLWPEFHAELEKRFLTKTQKEWTEIFAGSDACVSPVANLLDAPSHPHLAHRQTFVKQNGHFQPAPAPRFSRSGSNIGSSPNAPLADLAGVLKDWKT